MQNLTGYSDKLDENTRILFWTSIDPMARLWKWKLYVQRNFFTSWVKYIQQ